MSFSDLVRFVRSELNQNATFTLDRDQLCAASRTAGLNFDRQTGNEIADKLIEHFNQSELTLAWVFSVETFVNPNGESIFYLIGARNVSECTRARRYLQMRIKRDYAAGIIPIIVPHPH